MNSNTKFGMLNSIPDQIIAQSFQPRLKPSQPA